MDTRLEKYYNGRSVGENILRGSAVSALASLVNGNVYGGALFKMHTNDFMEKYLYPEDYAYWLDQKRKYEESVA